MKNLPVVIVLAVCCGMYVILAIIKLKDKKIASCFLHLAVSVIFAVAAILISNW